MQAQGEQMVMPTGWRFGAFELYPAQRRLLRDGVPVEIEERALDLLVLLASHHDRELQRREAVTLLWGTRPVSDTTLRQVLHKARRAVDDDGEHQNVIRTLHGRSLRWVAPLEAVWPDGGPAAMPVPVARPGRPARWLTAAVAVVVALTATVWWLGRTHAPADAPLPRVTIEPFANATGEPALDWIGNGLPALLGSLVEQGGGLDMVGATQVARAWKYTPQQGRDREQQLRYATGADVLVGGKLGKLTSRLYQLDLKVLVADKPPSFISIHGEQPGMLAADAVVRLRRQLGLVAAPPVATGLVHDPFVVEAFARGKDLATQGKWAEARMYYAVCVNNAPDFLQARIDLGVAQTKTDAWQAGVTTLKESLALAKKRGDDALAGRVLMQLGWLAINHGQAGDALGYMRQAVPLARVARDADTEAQAHLIAAYAADTLKQPDVAASELSLGERVLTSHPNLLPAKGVYYDIKGILAGSRHDREAQIAAHRAGLQLRESLGDERDVLVSMNNLANGLFQADHLAESLRVAAQAYKRAEQGHYRDLEFDTAINLGNGLIRAGLVEPAQALSDRLVELARQTQSKPWELLSTAQQANARLVQGDAQAALASARAGNALADPETSDASAYLYGQMMEAEAAFVAEPAALDDFNRRFDASVASLGHKLGAGLDAAFPRSQHLFHALAFAAARRPGKALASLRAAQAITRADSDGESDLREVSMMVAVADGDRAAAAISLAGFDVATGSNARLLSLDDAWARRIGDTALRDASAARLRQLQSAALAAVRAGGIDPERIPGSHRSL